MNPQMQVDQRPMIIAQLKAQLEASEKALVVHRESLKNLTQCVINCQGTYEIFGKEIPPTPINVEHQSVVSILVALSQSVGMLAQAQLVQFEHNIAMIEQGIAAIRDQLRQLESPILSMSPRTRN